MGLIVLTHVLADSSIGLHKTDERKTDVNTGFGSIILVKRKQAFTVRDQINRPKSRRNRRTDRQTHKERKTGQTD